MGATVAAPLGDRDAVNDAEGTPDRSTSRRRDVAPVRPVSMPVSGCLSATNVAAIYRMYL